MPVRILMYSFTQPFTLMLVKPDQPRQRRSDTMAEKTRKGYAAPEGREGTGSRPVDEKKDAPGRGKRRGDTDHQYDDAQALQAKGDRNRHSQPGRQAHGEPPRNETANPPQDNTVPGGNRPKGSNAGRQD